MKKLILLFTLVVISFSADKWEYIICQYHMKTTEDYLGFSVIGDKTNKANNLIKNEDLIRVTKDVGGLYPFVDFSLPNGMNALEDILINSLNI